MLSTIMLLAALAFACRSARTTGWESLPSNRTIPAMFCPLSPEAELLNVKHHHITMEGS